MPPARFSDSLQVERPGRDVQDLPWDIRSGSVLKTFLRISWTTKLPGSQRQAQRLIKHVSGIDPHRISCCDSCMARSARSRLWACRSSIWRERDGMARSTLVPLCNRRCAAVVFANAAELHGIELIHGVLRWRQVHLTSGLAKIISIGEGSVSEQLDVLWTGAVW